MKVKFSEPVYAFAAHQGFCNSSDTGESETAISEQIFISRRVSLSPSLSLPLSLARSFVLCPITLLPYFPSLSIPSPPPRSSLSLALSRSLALCVSPCESCFSVGARGTPRTEWQGGDGSRRDSASVCRERVSPPRYDAAHARHRSPTHPPRPTLVPPLDAPASARTPVGT